MEVVYSQMLLFLLQPLLAFHSCSLGSLLSVQAGTLAIELYLRILMPQLNYSIDCAIFARLSSRLALGFPWATVKPGKANVGFHKLGASTQYPRHEPLSKLLVSPLISPRIPPPYNPYVTPLKYSPKPYIIPL